MINTIKFLSNIKFNMLQILYTLIYMYIFFKQQTSLMDTPLSIPTRIADNESGKSRYLIRSVQNITHYLYFNVRGVPFQA